MSNFHIFYLQINWNICANWLFLVLHDTCIQPAKVLNMKICLEMLQKKPKKTSLYHRDVNKVQDICKLKRGSISSFWSAPACRLEFYISNVLQKCFWQIVCMLEMSYTSKNLHISSTVCMVADNLFHFGFIYCF